MSQSLQVIKLLPKIELHLHLDCSFSFDVVRLLRPNITEAEYRTDFIAPEKCYNLADFLKCAPSGISLMQTEKELVAVVRDLFQQLKAENVIYAEIRFAPLQHLDKGLLPENVVEIVAGTVKECIQNTGIKAGLILCTLRHFTEAQSLQTVNLVEKYIKNNLVVGFDLAADEAGYPIDNHISAFQYAVKKDIPRTAHAGEAKGAESVWETLENFKTQRIGHGVRSIEDPRLIGYLIENQIHLEVCPTCNIQTNVFREYSDHPIDKLYKKGISLSVNTDARSLVNVTLAEEYFKLSNTFGWEIKDFYNCNINALSSAFISDIRKASIKESLLQGYEKYL
jgi:adenosine deaminase